MSLSKEESLVHAQTAVSCNLCESEAPGEHYCHDCKHTLCSQCELIHSKLPSTKGHKVVLRTQIHDIDTRTLTCEEHGEDVTYHCEKCKIPICGKCVTTHHRGHELSDLDVLFQRNAEILQNYISKMQTDVLPCLNKKVEETRKARDCYVKKVDRVQKEMEEENLALHKQLDEIQSERLKKLIEIKESDLLVFDKHATEIRSRTERYQGTIAKYEDAVEKSILPNILDFSKASMSMPEIKKIPDFPMPPTFVAGNMKNLRANVGGMQDISSSTCADIKPSVEVKRPGNVEKNVVQVQVGSRPEAKKTEDVGNRLLQQATRQVRIIARFTSPLKGLPSISISMQGNVYLGGTNSKKVVIVDSRGKVVFKRRIQQSLLTFAVMGCEDIIYAPNPGILQAMGVVPNAVWRLMSDDRERVIFDESMSHCCGISITADQRILICTHSGKVYMINADGTNIRLISSGHAEDTAIHAIASPYGNIYVTDLSRQVLVIVRTDGTIGVLKQTLDGRALGDLVGLAVDKMGNILCADRTNHCVYIIDMKEQIWRLVDGLQHPPRWIAVDNENNLWIAQYDGTVLVLKY